MSVDADGSPHAYGPNGKGLDYLANAGHPGNWWAITVNPATGKPNVQGEDAPEYDDTCIGFYVSTTSYMRNGFAKFDPRKYLNPEIEYFFVLPSHWRTAIPGVVLGCKARITDSQSGTIIDGVIGDFGPRNHIGEASIAYARDFGLNPDPKTGGTEAKRFTYTFWPDVPADGFQLIPAT